MDNYQAELTLLSEMDKPTLQLHLIEQEGKMERNLAHRLADQIRQATFDIKFYRKMAKEYSLRYHEDKREEDLNALEQYTQLIKNEEQYKRGLWVEIKRNGGRSQWLRNQYKMTKQRKSTDTSKP